MGEPGIPSAANEPLLRQRRVSTLSPEMSGAERNEELIPVEYAFNGAWIPDEDALKIGPQNFADLQNFRYTDQGLEGIQGFSKINTTALAKPAIRSLIQFVKRINNAPVSMMLAQAYNAGLTSSSVYQNQTAIPNQGDFATTALHDDDSSAGLGRFALGPDGVVVYANQVESMIWGSAEHRCAAFINYDGSAATFRYDVTERVTNTLTDAPNRVQLALDASSDGYILVGSTRPLQGIKFYVQNANAGTSTSTVDYWDGSAWTAVSGFADGTASGGITLAQTGTMSFTSTASTAKVKSESQYLLYFYRVTVGATGTPDATIRISHCTVDAPFQQIVDVWDGVERTPIYVEAKDKDYTFEALEESNLGESTPIAVSVGGITSSEDMVVGFEERMTALKFRMFAANVNSVDSVLTFKYWNGTAWTAVTVTDGTARNSTNVGSVVFTGSGLDDATSGGTYSGSAPAVFVVTIDATGTPDTFEWSKDGSTIASGVSITGGAQTLSDGVTITFAATTGHTLNDAWSISTGQSLGQTGQITWDAPAKTSEFKQTIGGFTGYFYQLTWSATLSANVDVDIVTGIPAQRWNTDCPVGGYRFPFRFGERVMLVGRQEANEGNRIDYSATGAPDVWNGEDASDLGKSIFIGDHQDLTAAIEISNRFAGVIQNIAVLTKASQTWILTGNSPEDFRKFDISQSIGCPFPLTMTSADISFAVDQQTVRNVALWVSSRGPVMFDGGVLVPMRFQQSDGAISSIESYFDPNDSRYVNLAAAENARAWYDPRFSEYNILLPTGASTTCDTWLVCDLKRRKWFRKVPDVFPQVGVLVVDANGEQHTYGGIDTGYMQRLENGNTWDGTAINHIVDTADIFLSGSMWDETIVRYMKMLALTESGTINDMSISHSPDGTETFTQVDTLVMTGTGRYQKKTSAQSLLCASRQFRFQLSTSAQTKAPQLVAWGVLYRVQRRELL